MRDPYQVLGVPRSASEADIKQAFRKLAKTHHPDQNAGDPKAQARFSEVNGAYEILGDKEKRGKFDRGEIDAEGKPKFTGFEGFNTGGGYGQSGFGSGGFGTGGAYRTTTDAGGADDILREIFGEGFGGMGRGGKKRRAAETASAETPARGSDLALVAAVTLEDIVGAGKARVVMPDGRTLSVKLPAGPEPGQQIRLKGQGAPSPNGGPAGDAIVTIVFEPHAVFRVDGSNLRSDIAVRLDEAVLGARLRVPTLEGEVELAIPAGTTGTKALRLRGKGLPTKAGGRGDLLVTPRIALPDEADAGLEQLMRRWQEMKTYDPRSAGSE
jgi:DnaJ-class molecular chaperone